MSEPAALDLAAIRAEHTKMGEPCEHCKHQFPYDDCVACGETWPCSAVLLADELGRCRSQRDALRELLAGLSYATGQYIECDERPRTPELWTAMCEAQTEAAVYLNTGALGEVTQ